MNILSLFDGMACGRLALERAGIEATNYYASEIDKYAMQIAKKNYPDIIHVGDVTKLRAEDLPRIDLIIGGSPCQGFSFAGRRLNFEDPRSKLFFEFVRLVRECRPGFFLLENVKMKKEYQDVISEQLGVQPIEINSALVSAQMRKRLYWANWEITQPEDKGIVLQDILEDAVTDRDKSYCIDAHYSKIAEAGKCAVEDYLTKARRQLVYQINESKESGGKQPYQQNRVYDPRGKHPAICAGGERGGVPCENPAAIRGRYTNKAVIVGRRINDKGHRDDYNKEIQLTQCLEVRATNTDKSNCVTTVDKDNVLTPLPAGRYLDPYGNQLPFRKLTPVECERLQTVPDNYTEGVSNSQRYKMLGNGWTVDVIAHIIKCLDSRILC